MKARYWLLGTLLAFVAGAVVLNRFGVVIKTPDVHKPLTQQKLLNRELPAAVKDHAVPKKKYGNIAELPRYIALAQQRLSVLAPNWYEEHVDVKKSCESVRNKKGKVVQKCRTIKIHRTDFEVVLAVAHIDALEDIHFVTFRSDAAISRSRLSGGEFAIHWEKFNGCNTAFEVQKPTGYILLGMRRPIGEGTSHRDVVYTAYTRDIDTPEMRQVGWAYTSDTFAEAQRQLALKKVKSQAFRGEFVSDVMPVELARRLGMIEHIDPPRVLRGEPTEQLVGEVLVITAANRGNAYTCSKSKAGAYGWLQFMPKTYAGVVGLRPKVTRGYPEAKLIPEFVKGMNEHTNAAQATMLLFDSDWARIKSPDYRRWLRAHPDELEDYLAAMYNCGCAWRRIEQYGQQWREHLPSETKTYLVKLREVRKVLG